MKNALKRIGGEIYIVSERVCMVFDGHHDDGLWLVPRERRRVKSVRPHFRRVDGNCKPQTIIIIAIIRHGPTFSGNPPSHSKNNVRTQQI